MDILHRQSGRTGLILRVDVFKRDVALISDRFYKKHLLTENSKYASSQISTKSSLGLENLTG